MADNKAPAKAAEVPAKAAEVPAKAPEAPVLRPAAAKKTLTEVYIPKQYLNGEGMTVRVNDKTVKLNVGLNKVEPYIAKVAQEALKADGLA